MRNKFCAATLVLLAFSLTAGAQTFGEITGQVSDSTGALIGGASITITNAATNAQRAAVSNEAGIYSFPSLAPGNYGVRAEKPGFKAYTAKIEVQVQQTVRLDLIMEVGSVTETIEVSGQVQLLTTENATVGTVVENKRIVELPLNGRNYLQLVSLAPNTSTGFPSAGQARSRQGAFRAEQSIAVGGQRSSFNHYSLDGVENTDPNFNTFVIQPSIDALQEFKVQTGIYPAEFGRATTQINVMTKSGGNDFHGTAFEFLRNDKLDAKSYAFRSARPPKDPFKWNQYGGTLSGPVIIPKVFNGKDRLFFMGNYEAFRQRRSNQALYVLPTAAQQNGDFGTTTGGLWDPKTRTGSGNDVTSTPFAGGIIPASRIDPISKRLRDEFYRLPNLTGTSSQNYQQPQGAPINRDQFILRMDFVESSKSQWSGRYSWGDEVQFNDGLRLNGSQVLTNVEQYMGTNTRTLSANVVNETRFGYTRFYNSTARQLAGVRDVVKELAIPGLASGAPITWGIPSVGFTNYSGLGDDSEGPYENKNNSMQFLNNTSWVRGRHTIRFGGEVRRDQFNQDGNQFARGSFGFEINATRSGPTGGGGNAFADFLLGEVRRPETAVAIGSARFRATTLNFYVDDSWKITNRVTLALGLRYENTPPWLDTTGKLFSAAIPAMDSTPNVADRSRYPVFVRQGRGQNPYDGIAVRWPNIDVVWDGRLGDRMVRRDNNDFAPRIGITWSPTDKWVIRSGAGMFYAQDTGNPRFDMARNIAGRFRQEAVSDFPDRQWGTAFREIAGAFAQVPQPYTFANLYDRRTPYVMQYLLNVQREFRQNLAFEIGYLGSVSRKLESLRAVNEALPGPTGSVISRSPYPNFGRIQLVDNGGRGNYNSLGMKLTKKYSNGLSALFSYTYAKSIDETSGIRVNDGDTLFPQNSYCQRCERGLSTFDTRHRAVTSVLYDLPVGKGRQKDISNPFLNAVAGGWQVGSIVTLSTGFPLTVGAGRDQSNTGAGNDRPSYIAGVNANLSNHDPVRWYNPAAYILQPFGTFGNVGRNTLISPSIFNWDFSTLKNFAITERHTIQFRFEAFNIPNHPNWGNPDTNAGQIQRDAAGNITNPGNFGVIGGTRTNMRQLQFALKYIF